MYDTHHQSTEIRNEFHCFLSIKNQISNIEMTDAFEVTPSQSKLWTPLHIRKTTNSSKNCGSNSNIHRSAIVCTPEQTCEIYEQVLNYINRDNERLKQMIET